MTENSSRIDAHKAQIQNSALLPLAALTGEWRTESTHPMLKEKVQGRASFTWIEGGSFLVWHTEYQSAVIPTGIAVIGSDNVLGTVHMLYFDERNVSRRYDVSIEKNVIRWWRNAPKFSQRYAWQVSADGQTIEGHGEISKDDASWEEDLQTTFIRVR